MVAIFGNVKLSIKYDEHRLGLDPRGISLSLVSQPRPSTGNFVYKYTLQVFIFNKGRHVAIFHVHTYLQ